MPGREACIRRGEHLVSRLRVGVPFAPRLEVHWAELPLPKRIVYSRLETTRLLLFSDLQPVLDEKDAIIGDCFLEEGTELQETIMLLRRTVTHHLFDSRPVVPAAVKNHDFSRRRKLRQIALNIELGLLTVRWSWKRHDAKDARTDPFRDGLDDAAFACRITSLKDDD